MPSKTKAQHNLMAMVANDPAAAKRVGIPQSVGQEFMKADKGKKFETSRPSHVSQMKINNPITEHGRSAINKSKTDHGDMRFFSKGGDMAESKKMMQKEVAFMKAKGAPKSMIKHEEIEMKGAKRYAMGGMVMPSKMGKVTAGGKRPHGEHTVQQKGHTKAKQIVMKRGGKC